MFIQLGTLKLRSKNCSTSVRQHTVSHVCEGYNYKVDGRSQNRFALILAWKPLRENLSSSWSKEYQRWVSAMHSLKTHIRMKFFPDLFR